MQHPFTLSNPIHLLAIGLGSGLLKPAPGTWGTLAALPLVYLSSTLVSTQGLEYIILSLLVFAIGVPICGITAKDIGVHDHSSIVWDEFAGLFVTFLFIPLSTFSLVAGFLLFRLFDIVKPWPIKALDKSVHGGLGIMIDDILAGLLACACLHILIHFGLI